MRATRQIHSLNYTCCIQSSKEISWRVYLGTRFVFCRKQVTERQVAPLAPVLIFVSIVHKARTQPVGD
jgi:hypothetical protein